jgi:hypothetical protein
VFLLLAPLYSPKREVRPPNHCTKMDVELVNKYASNLERLSWALVFFGMLTQSKKYTDQTLSSIRMTNNLFCVSVFSERGRSISIIQYCFRILGRVLLLFKAGAGDFRIHILSGGLLNSRYCLLLTELYVQISCHTEHVVSD